MIVRGRGTGWAKPCEAWVKSTQPWTLLKGVACTSERSAPKSRWGPHRPVFDAQIRKGFNADPDEYRSITGKTAEIPGRPSHRQI